MDFDRMITLDFETTGLKPGFQPLEIAWIEFDENLNAVGEVSSLLNTKVAIEPGAQRAHGITTKMLEGKPNLQEFLQSQHPTKFRDEHVLVVAHNVSYDIPFFRPFCKQVTALCTMRLGQLLYPSLENFRLKTLASHLGVEVTPNHRALTDAKTCFELLKKYGQTNNLTITELVNAANNFSPNATIPFGKHKGTKIVDLPSDYRNWLSENLDPDHWIVAMIKCL
jgi:DNA polymerase-3 subunit epsilon